MTRRETSQTNMDRDLPLFPREAESSQVDIEPENNEKVKDIMADFEKHTKVIDTDVAPDAPAVTESKPVEKLSWAQEAAGYTIVNGRIVRPDDEYTEGDVYRGPGW